MTAFLLDWLRDFGPVALYAAMLVEGAAVPFPGIVAVLTYGYLFPSAGTFRIAAVMSAIYSVASLLPYYIGLKLGWLLQRKASKGLNKAGALFIRYGYWSVAVARPFGLGNYISYVAGMAGMDWKPYLGLTFLGIYPWCCTMLLVGRYFNGNYGVFRSFVQANSHYLWGPVAAAVGGAVFALVLVRRKRSRAGIRKGETGSV